MMTTVLTAATAGLAVLVAVLVTLLVARRASGAADERLETVIADMNARMESIVRELGGALERAEAQGRRQLMLGELSGSIDLDEVLTRTLEAAARVEGADAALAWLRATAEGRPLIATLGLSAEEAEREGAVAGPPDGRRARSITISYRYDEEQQREPGLIHAGVAVPLGTDGESIGQLAVFTRSPEHVFGDEAIRELEELAERGGPALENARRFREARQLADLDALTGLHNRRFFHETLAREVARAQRYGRRLALIVLDLDDFKAVNDRIGHLAGDEVLADAAQRLREDVRFADVGCRVGGDEFAVIMPESTLADGEQLFRRILAAVSSRPTGQAGTISLSAGVTELLPDDDERSFFQRADDALYRAKGAGKAQVVEASG